MTKLINLIPGNNKPVQKEALADMEVALPSKVEKFLERLVQTIKSYNLPKKKEQAVIARVMDSMGITSSELNQAVQKLKKYDVVKRQRTGNDDHDWMGESLTEAIKSPEEAIEYLKGLISKGEFDKQAIDALQRDLMSVRYKFVASKRNPDSYKTAAAKAKQTRAQNAKDLEVWSKKMATQDANEKAANKRRKDNNLLPLTTDDYSKKPDSKYYKYDYQERGGWGVYKLKDEWRRKPVAPATAAQYWGNND